MIILMELVTTYIIQDSKPFLKSQPEIKKRREKEFIDISLPLYYYKIVLQP